MKTKTVHHPTLPTSQDVPAERVSEWLEQGWLESQSEEVAAEAAYDPAKASIKEVLAHVGDDAALAAEALTFEQAKGDNARTSLVSQLEKLTAPVGTNQEGAQA